MRRWLRSTSSQNPCGPITEVRCRSRRMILRGRLATSQGRQMSHLSEVLKRGATGLAQSWVRSLWSSCGEVHCRHGGCRSVPCRPNAGFLCEILRSEVLCSSAYAAANQLPTGRSGAPDVDRRQRRRLNGCLYSVGPSSTCDINRRDQVGFDSGTKGVSAMRTLQTQMSHSSTQITTFRLASGRHQSSRRTHGLRGAHRKRKGRCHYGADN